MSTRGFLVYPRTTRMTVPRGTPASSARGFSSWGVFSPHKTRNSSIFRTMGTSLSKFARGRQAIFAHLHGPDRQNAAMGIKRQGIKSVLAHNLNRLMDHADVSQTTLGKKAGVDPSTIGRIRTQKNAPDIETLEAICTALGVAVWQALVPDMDPANLPVLQNATAQERELYDRLRAAAELLSPPHQKRQ